MMSKLGPWIATAAMLVALVPAASAQAFPVAFSPTWPGALSPTAATSVPFNVTLECAFLLSKGGSVDVDVGLSSPPPWLNASPVRVSFAVTACTGGAGITRSGTLSLVTSQQAPGLVPFDLTAQASVVGGTEKGTSTTQGLVISYRPGHSLTPDGDQTFEVRGKTYSFVLKIDISANAQTMVMFEDKTVQVGTLDGVRAMTFDVAKGERSITYNVLFAPPTAPWNQSKVTFRTYSHCLVGDGCNPQLERTITWVFVNHQPATLQGDPTTALPPGGKSPGPELGPLLAVGLAALIVARHRRGSQA